VDVLVESGFGRLAWPEIKATFAALCAERPDAQAAVQAALELVGRDGFLTMSKALLKAGRRAPDVRLPGPLLILYGSRDSNGAVLQEAMRTLQARHPHARTEVIPDAGHCAHLDQPKRFSAAVETFLSEFAAVGGEPPRPSHEEGATPDRFDASS
jgi:3-oxoadipate enol-lactonase